MIHDTASVTLVAHQAALQIYPQAMVAPPVSVGISPHWMDRKGTLTLREETFLAVVFEICESLKTHGVKNIFIVNGHGGNGRPLRENVEGFRKKLGINIRAESYWAAYTPEIISKYMESKGAPGSPVVAGHAGEFETSIAMAAFPERVHWEGVDYEKAKQVLRIKDPASARQDEHYFYEAKLASTAKGEAMIAIAVNWLAGQLRQMISGA
jgi:creatinine amidohydrolase